MVQLLGTTSPCSHIKTVKYFTNLNLESLNLSGCSFIENFEEIEAFNKLKKLKLYNSLHFGNDNIDLGFLRKNKDLTYLDIGLSDAICDLSPVYTLDQLTTLILGPMEYGGASSDGIENLERLKHLHAGGFVQKKDLERIKKLSKLERFNYDRFTMGEECIDTIKNTYLR